MTTIGDFHHSYGKSPKKEIQPQEHAQPPLQHFPPWSLKVIFAIVVVNHLKMLSGKQMFQEWESSRNCAGSHRTCQWVDCGLSSLCWPPQSRAHRWKDRRPAGCSNMHSSKRVSENNFFWFIIGIDQQQYRSRARANAVWSPLPPFVSCVCIRSKWA